MTTNGLAVETRGLGFRVGDLRILEDVNLRLEPRQLLGVMGMSGCGKTTLLKCLIGLVRPTEGDVLVEGRSIVGLREPELAEARRCMGMCFQYAALFDSLTVGENVAFPLRQHTRMTEDEIWTAVADKLAVVHMEGRERQMPAELSGGERKRVGIARAIALGPDIVLYDEPSSGLDPIMAGVMDHVIVDLRDELGVSQIVVSHHVQNVLAICDRVIMLHKGRQLAEGTAQEMRNSQDPAVQQFIRGRAEGPIVA